jgi:hypothetical protein
MTANRTDPDFGAEIEVEATAPGPGQLYRGLLLLEAHPHFLRSAHAFASGLAEEARPDESLRPRSRDTRDVPGWILRVEAWARADLDAAGHMPVVTPEDRLLLLRHYAPAGLIEGAWLQGATGLAAAERPIGLLCQEQFRVRASGQSARALFGRPLRTLLAPAIGDHVECHHQAFVRNCGIAPQAFEHALAGLCLGLFPSTFLPEIAGFELWQACTGCCPPLIRPAEGAAAVTGRLVRQAREIVAEAASDARRTDGDALERVLRGFTLAHNSYRRWRSTFDLLRARSTPSHRMLALLEAKAAQAVGHHAGIEVAGKGFDSYFERGADGCRELLSALAGSPYICPARPQWSPLLTSAVRPRGAMFGVFSPEELATIEAWIREIADGAPTQPADVEIPPLAGRYLPPHRPGALKAAAEARFGELSAARLSYHLVNVDRYPLARVASRNVADAFAALLDRLAARVGPCPAYDFSAVDRLAGDRDGSRRTRPAARGEGLGAAYPLLCTSGSWLQGAARVDRLHRPFALELFDMYRAQNGAGDPAQNQNRLARRKLEAGGLGLPPLTDRAFYEAPGDDAGFVLLCGSLALALNAGTFEPELLGFNLAIERSGRSFAARRAILGYLDQASNLGPEVVEHLWRRVWSGFHGGRILLDSPHDAEVLAAFDAAQSASAASDAARARPTEAPSRPAEARLAT